MKCKISDACCIYYACMSDDCQKKIVMDQGYDWSKGNCHKLKLKNMSIKKQKEENLYRKGTSQYKCMFCKNYTQEEMFMIGGESKGLKPQCSLMGTGNSRKHIINPNFWCNKYEFINKK